jgi:hypothetical protein
VLSEIAKKTGSGIEASAESGMPSLQGWVPRPQMRKIVVKRSRVGVRSVTRGCRPRH